MEKLSNYELKKIDAEKLAETAKVQPELAMPEKHPQFTAEFLKKIGIDYSTEKSGKGYIKLYPFDFIVEEITQDRRIVDISPAEIILPEEISSSRTQVSVDLIKQGIDTFEAVERIAAALEIDVSDIKTAGLKDGKALTAQNISISGVGSEKIKSIKIPNIILKNIHQRKGVVETGSLWGNKFTIFVRCDEKNNIKVDEKINAIKDKGFYNFFSLQRFGPRLINTELGRLILQCEFEQAVHLFLTAQSSFETLALKNIRAKVENCWGDWEKMRQEFKFFPYFFRYEIALLDKLIESDGKYFLGLKAIESQTKMFAYSYGSFWFNKLLSDYIESGQPIPESLPVIANNAEVKEIYKKIMPLFELESLKLDQEVLQFLGLDRSRAVSTVIMPEIHRVLILPTGYIFCFSLGKGAYATSFLADFFELYQGNPVPLWVDKNRYDIKASLSEAPVKETSEKFLTDEKENSVVLSQDFE